MDATQSLTERLTAQIVATIHAEQLQPGAPLPSARALAERYAVTVPTIREALRRLEATGAVSLRHGSGTYVGASIERRILGNPHYAPHDRIGAIELVEARIAIEPGIAHLAATARDDGALAALVEAADNALHADGVAPEASFHARLAAATGNRALRETVESLLELHQRARLEARVRYDRVLDHTEHLDIVDAVRRGDGVEAAHRTERHLRSIHAAIVGGGDA